MKKEELIGKKVRGFRFDHKKLKRLQYIPKIMDNYIGKIGVIEEYNIIFDSYRVKFEDGMSYHYPVERIEHHLVDEELTIEIKEGDYIRGFETTPRSLEFANKYVGVIGRVVSLYESSIAVEFSGGTIVHYPKDQAITHICNDDMKEFEKSLDQNEEPDKETKAKVERAMKALERGIANSKWNESCIDYGKIEHDPLDDLPIIGEGVLMEVSNYEQEENWNERYVFGKSESGFLAWYEDKSNITLWKHARPITKTKISRKEFESKFEIID
jgi:hypothetical protein